MKRGWLVAGLVAMALVAMTGIEVQGVGCASTAPPSALERKFFDITTNQVQQVAWTTNVVTLTNQVVEHITETNTANQVVTHDITNYVAVPTPVAVTVTNTHTEYTYAPNANAKGVANIGGALAGFSGIPGAGALATALLGGFFGVWGHLRGNKAQRVSGTLAQVIEVGRELLARTPQGNALADGWTNWMIQHQAEQGVIQSVIGLLPKVVDNRDAQEVANQLAQLMANPRGQVAATGQPNGPVQTSGPAAPAKVGI